MIQLIWFLLLLAACNAAVINGLHRAFSFETLYEEGLIDHPYSFDPEHSQILGRLHYWLSEKWGATICKPLFSCVACMASVHSTYFFWPIVLSIMPFGWPMVWAYVLYIPTVSTIGVFIESIIE